MKKVVVVVRVKANGDPKLIILTISEGKNMAVSNPMIFSIESLKRYAFSSPREQRIRKIGLLSILLLQNQHQTNFIKGGEDEAKKCNKTSKSDALIPLS